MKHWIFISSPKQFRMDDWLSCNDYVEFVQRNKVEVNDIVYLYTTAPVQRIEYKMIVDRINVPYSEMIDDSAASQFSTSIRPALMYAGCSNCLKRPA